MASLYKPSLPPAPAARSDFLGAIDEVRGDRISGWAVTREGDPCGVELVVNGHRLSAMSNLPRPDLAAKQQARGKGGWRIALGEALVAGSNTVEAYFPDGTALAGSPREVAWSPAASAAAPAAMTYLGAIDVADPSRLSGWALNAVGEPCEVAVRIGDGEPELLLSERPRADLAAKGMSTGGGGWQLPLAGRLAPGPNQIAITLPDGRHLPRSPLLLDGPEAVAPEVAETPVADAPPAPAPVRTAIIAEFPERRAQMPSLAELDDLSLDDLALAVASGRVRTDAPPAPSDPIPSASATPVPAPEAVAAPPVRRSGWLRRLTGR